MQLLSLYEVQAKSKKPRHVSPAYSKRPSHHPELDQASYLCLFAIHIIPYRSFRPLSVQLVIFSCFSTRSFSKLLLTSNKPVIDRRDAISNDGFSSIPRFYWITSKRCCEKHVFSMLCPCCSISLNNVQPPDSPDLMHACFKLLTHR